MGERNVIVVDGANIAHIEESQKGQPKVSNLVKVHTALEERGYEPITIIDASLVHSVDDPDQLEALLEKQVFHQAPAETDADYFVLETADQYQARVVSNDRFSDYQDRYPWIENRRVPVMIINGKVAFYGPKLGDEQ